MTSRIHQWTIDAHDIDAHLDLHPADGDVDREVQRLVALGASHADVGQGPDEAFIVLRDPGGNEFCILKQPKFH
jgi:hypothetical protein